MDALILAGIVLAVVVLLVSEWVRADLVAMLALGALMASRILEPAEALSGLSNPATVTVAAMFVLSAGLNASGAVAALGERLLGGRARGELTLLVLIVLVIGPVSAFINNTAAVAVFLPLAVRAAHASSISPSRLLMPLAFVAVLGGTCTLIGTSTNILVSSLAAQHGLEPFSMFELTGFGASMLAAGAAYLLLAGRSLIPERIQPERGFVRGYKLDHYLSELIVPEGSALAGRTLREARLGERYDVEVLGLVREETTRAVPSQELRLEVGDILLVKAAAQSLVQIERQAGLSLRPGQHPDDARLQSPDSVMLEALVAPNSALEGRTLKDVNFRARYGATCLAVRRRGVDLRVKIGRMPLRLGDELLLLVRRDELARLTEQHDFVVVEELEVRTLRAGRAAIAGAIVAGVIGAAALGIAPIVVSATIGAALMVLTGCLSPERLYREIDWKIIILLAGMIPLGLALEKTGAAEDIVKGLLALLGDWSPQAMLGLVIAATYIVTGFLSNTATAALLVPLALGIAAHLGVEPRPFLVAVAFAASAAFYTPVGYQTNLLVYSPGGYRFVDYLRVGGPLNVLLGLLATLLIPFFFPFAPAP